MLSMGMKLYQRKNGYWYARDGERKISLGTRDAAEARRLFARLKRDKLLANVAKLEQPAKLSLSDFRKQFAAHLSAHARESTAKRSAYSLKKFAEHCGGARSISAITARDLDAYQADELRGGRKKSGVAADAKFIRAAFAQAVKWELLKQDPFRNAARLKVDERPPRWYSPDELTRILAGIDDEEFRDFVELLLHTGARLSELFYLRPADVDLENRMITFRRSKTRWRSVPMDERAAEILWRRKLPWRWSRPNALSVIWRRYADKIGLSGRLHDLRHSFASYLVSRGVHMAVVKELLGHTDIKTTMIYAHLSPEHLREAVDVLGGAIKPKLRVIK